MAEITEAEIIEKAKELGLLLKDSTIVKEFVAAKAAYESDRQMQELLGQFNLHKMTIAMLSKQENPDEARIEEHEQKLNNVYDKIMESALMVAFQEKSHRVDTIVGNINSILNLYVSGDNLWYWSPFHTDYVDPEQAMASSDARIYPFSKTFTFGLNLTF